MKFLFSLIIVILSLNFCFSEVLPPNPKIGRNSEVLSDKIFVRIKSGTDIFNPVFVFNNDKNLRIEHLLTPNSSLTFNTKLRSVNLLINQNKIYEAEEKLLRTFIIYFKSDLSPEDYCKELLKNNPAVEIAEPYYLPKFLSYKPNDELIDMQDDYLQLIKAYDAWGIEKGNPDIIIGISDSGTNQQHEDIIQNLAINTNEIPNDGIDNDENGYIDDYNGYNFSWQNSSQNPSDTYNSSILHGQQVTGIAGATTDNSIGIAGTGFKCSILPMKIVEGTSLKYAYESIVYAAVRGVKVLNCSWGVVKPFSEIDQSIIDYAISKDVAIVAAAGNTGSKVTKYDVFYPASYYGVLGVGEVTSIDRLSSTSSISAGCRILAPGDDNYTTTNNGYFTCDGGTSFAAPVVSGALALVRSKYPQLSALQSLEFIRQQVDIHDNFSSTDKLLIPGRINMFKALTTDPFSIPAILPHKISYFDKNNQETDRFVVGDKVKLKIMVKNLLGSVSNVTFQLRVAYDPASSITINNDKYFSEYIEAGTEIEINDFELTINQNFSGNVILRVDITNNSGYSDFFKFNFVPTRDVSTFSNNKLKFSMSDLGEFGYSTNGSTISGVGFVYENFGNQIYRNSSVMFSDNQSRIIYNSSINKYYGFQSEKGFLAPDRFTAIFNDDNAGNQKIGIQINQTISFPSENSKAVKMTFKITNKSNAVISGGSLGLYIDWDVSSTPTKNYSKLLNSAIPEEYWLSKAVAQEVYVLSDFPRFGSAVYSAESNISPQSAGLDYQYNGNFDNNFRIASLHSGVLIQSDKESDYGTVVGMKFNGNWEPNQTKECTICVAAGSNSDDLAKELKECLFEGVSVADNLNLMIDEPIIYPNPVENVLRFSLSKFSDNLSYSIYDLIGNKILKDNNSINYHSGEIINVDLRNFQKGIYILKIIANNKIYYKKIMKN